MDFSRVSKKGESTLTNCCSYTVRNANHIIPGCDIGRAIALAVLFVVTVTSSINIAAADDVTIMFKRTSQSEAPKKITGTTISSFIYEGILGADYVRSISRQSGTFTQYQYGLMMGEKDKSAEFTIRLADSYVGCVDSIIVTASQVYPTRGGDPSAVTLSVNGSDPLPIVTESSTARLPFVFLCDPTEELSQINIKSSNRVFLYTVRLVYNDGTTEITDIFNDGIELPIEYYNLNGVKVNLSRQPAGIYIMRQGNRVKTFIHRP